VGGLGGKKSGTRGAHTNIIFSSSWLQVAFEKSYFVGCIGGRSAPKFMRCEHAAFLFPEARTNISFLSTWLLHLLSGHGSKTSRATQRFYVR
jgi:hypothetical protein